jgi:flagellar secretion chaperone FliS
MSYASSAERYREAQILSASPGQLLLIVYDYLTASLHRARLAIERNDPELRWRSVDGACRAVTELLCTVDQERGGPLARQLVALYAYLLGEFVVITGPADLPKLERLTGLVMQLRDAFISAAARETSPVS